MKNADGNLVKCGSGCEECYIIGMDHLRYKSWGEFDTAHKKEPAVQALVTQIRGHLRNPQKEKEFESSDVVKSLGAVVRVDSTWDAKTEADLRRELGVQRLSKEQMHKIPSLIMPENGAAPTADATGELFLFPVEDAAVKRQVVVSTFLQLSAQVGKLSSGHNTWPLHDDTLLNDLVSAEMDERGVNRSFNGLLTPFDEFVTNYKEWQEKQNKKRTTSTHAIASSSPGGKSSMAG